jgi:hypothetical protein
MSATLGLAPPVATFGAGTGFSATGAEELFAAADGASSALAGDPPLPSAARAAARISATDIFFFSAIEALDWLCLTSHHRHPTPGNCSISRR